MRTGVITVVLGVVVASCSDSRQVWDTTALQGVWRIAEVHGDPLPEECQRATYEISSTTMTMRSGTLSITTKYRAVSAGGGFKLEQTSLSHNGGQNCQGLSAQYVASHYLQDLDVDLVDNRLRIFFPSREYDTYTDFVREGDNSQGGSDKPGDGAI